jgi:hypothetical protein
MTNPTSNYGWQMPTATDLVTDLPADFEVFGQAVDTAMADLLGGTTGQVLKKNSNTNMDFVWAADSAGMTNPMTTTGDTIYSSSGSTPARLAIGSTGNVLTVAAGVPSWAAPASGGLTVAEIATGTLSGASVTISSLSTYDQLFIQLRNVDMSSVTGMGIRINNNSGAGNYIWNGFSVTPSQTTGNTQAADDSKFMPFYQGNLPSSAQDNCSGFTLTNCKSAGFTTASWTSAYKNSNTYLMAEAAQGIYKVAEAVSSLVFVANSGTMDGGTYKIWGG